MLKDDIKKHVEANCATYAGSGRCHLDRLCPFFQAGDNLPRCLYYETSVLPGDDGLKARYWQSFGVAYWGEQAKPCKRCSRLFTPDDKRQQYCKDCGEAQRKESQSRRKREQRKRAGN